MEAPINGAFAHLESGMQPIGPTLEPVVEIDATFGGVSDISLMKKAIKERLIVNQLQKDHSRRS